MNRVDFQVDKFDKEIREKGTNILWEEAILCTCVGENKGQPSVNCKSCNGSGYLYTSPQETIALASRLSGKTSFDSIGSRGVGDTFLTPLSSIIMGFHDRITFTDYNSKYSEVISVKLGKSLKLRHPVKKLISVNYHDLSIDPSTMEIINNGWNVQIDPNIINSYLNDDKKQKGNDFYVSLLYMTSPSYYIIDIPHELRGTQVGSSTNFVELPKQYLLKREDFSYAKTTDQT